MEINRNMRCIEMPLNRFRPVRLIWINRNMRCIEMPEHQPEHQPEHDKP